VGGKGRGEAFSGGGQVILAVMCALLFQSPDHAPEVGTTTLAGVCVLEPSSGTLQPEFAHTEEDAHLLADCAALDFSLEFTGKDFDADEIISLKDQRWKAHDTIADEITHHGRYFTLNHGTKLKVLDAKTYVPQVAAGAALPVAIQREQVLDGPHKGEEVWECHDRNVPFAIGLGDAAFSYIANEPAEPNHAAFDLSVLEQYEQAEESGDTTLMKSLVSLDRVFVIPINTLGTIEDVDHEYARFAIVGGPLKGRKGWLIGARLHAYPATLPNGDFAGVLAPAKHAAGKKK